jgi:hypothetical protein
MLIIKTKKTFKTTEIRKNNKCNYKLTFPNISSEKSKNDVRLAHAFLGFGD